MSNVNNDSSSSNDNQKQNVDNIEDKSSRLVGSQ